MHPATVIASKQQRRPLTMQRLIIFPAKSIGQVRAVQLGPLMQLIGQLDVGQFLIAQ
ncbi:hypothetical protein D3C78_1727400 [compost metagenome]